MNSISSDLLAVAWNAAAILGVVVAAFSLWGTYYVLTELLAAIMEDLEARRAKR